jgi:hypothetical protein
VAFLLTRVAAQNRTVAQPFARAFVDAVASSDLRAPGASGGAGAMAGSFAIREDDLSIFDSLQAALAAAAPAGFFLHAAAPAAAIVGVAGAIAKVLRDLFVKGAWLDEEKARILLILKANIRDVTSPGLSSADIYAIVARSTPDLDIEWVNRQLAGLMFVPVRLGTRAFVVRDAADRWRPLV